MTNKLLCKRCLLKDLSKDEYFQSIYEYIESISEDVKIPVSEYNRRLEICRCCDNLVNGMCKLCGCFVEVRAIKKGTCCADTPQKW